jgi:hypothetical protein
MKDNLIDIIYPTIRKKFDELYIKFNETKEMVYFLDNKKSVRLAYDMKSKFVFVSLPYFMLYYFGFKQHESKEHNELNDLFRNLLKETLGDDFHDGNITFIYA